LVGQIKVQPPDVSQQRLKRLSDAFDATRYVAFPPPGGLQDPPSSSFGTAQADEAYDMALLLVEWAKVTHPMYHGFAVSSSSSGASIPSGIVRQKSAGASSADLAAAEARARTAEQEVARLNEALQTAQVSVGEKVERELRPMRDMHESVIEELKKEHNDEQGELQQQIEKLEKKVKKLERQLAIANEHD
jgi:polyhydroxyalkanoate synthesis regulator phasin